MFYSRSPSGGVEKRCGQGGELERCRVEHLGVDVLQQVSSWWGRESVVRGVSWRWRGVVGGDVPLWSCFQRCCGVEQVPCHRSLLRAVL